MTALVLDSSAKIARGLELYKVSAIVEIAAELGLPSDPSSTKLERLRAIVSFINSPACARFLVGKLSPEHWSVLRAERLRYEAVRLPALRDRLVAIGLSPQRAVEVLIDLLRKGALVPVGRPEWGRLDLVASDRELERFVVAVPPRIADVARERPLPPLPSIVTSLPPRVEPADFAALQREVFLALLTASRQGIRITAKNLPHRVDVGRLALALTGGSSGASRTKTAKRAPEPWPRLWFSLALLHGSSLVSDEAFVYELTTAGRAFQRSSLAAQAKTLYDAWLASPWSELHRVPDLILSDSSTERWHWAADGSTWIGTHIPSRPALERARRIIESTLRALVEEAPAGDQWLDLGKFAMVIRQVEPEFLVPFGNLDGYYGYYRGGNNHGTAFYAGISRRNPNGNVQALRRIDDWMLVEGAYIANVIAEPLHWLGLVDLGRNEAGALVAFRLTSLARHVLFDEPLPQESGAGPRLVVQPSFELIVLDASKDLDLVATIEEFAERQTLDRAAVYRLTRDSVVSGLERGLSGAEIVHTLETASGAPLPQNVAFTLAEWVHQYERFHMRRGAIVIEADSPDQLDRWCADDQIASHLGPRLSPTFALVPTASHNALSSALVERGYRPLVVDYSRPTRQTIQFQDAVTFTVHGHHDDLYQRYRLGSFAEIVEQSPTETTYRITREAATRRNRQREAVALFVEYLQRHLREPLPADTLLHLYGWSGEVTELRAADVVAVEVPAGMTWPELLTVADIAACKPHVVTPDIALVQRVHVDELRRVLAQRGISLGDGLEFSSASNPPKRQPSNRAPAAAYPPGSGPVRLVNANPAAVRAELQRALRQLRSVTLSLFDEQRGPVSIRMQPIGIYRLGDEYFLRARCFECPGTHLLDIADILAVTVE